MSMRLKQCAVIEFLTAENNTPTQIHRRLMAVYESEAVDRATVSRWAIRARKSVPGKLNNSDELRPERTISVSDETHRTRIDELIQSDRRITQSVIAETLGISKERVSFVIQQLGYRKICARWVPRQFTDEHKRKRLEACTQLLDRYRVQGEFFLFNIVTGDESWVNHYDPEDKRQSMQYRHRTSPQPKKFKTIASAKKVLLTVFFDASGVVIAEFLEKGATVNFSRYIKTLKTLRRRV